MMKTKLLAAVLAVGMSASSFAADTYVLDSAHTYPTFEINHLGYSTTRGRFDKTEGKIMLDMAARTGSLDATIYTGSLSTGFDKRDAHVKSEDFFNVEKFPTVAVKANKFVFNGDVLVAAEGTLTILGVTKPVKLDVSNFKCGAHPMSKKAMCGAEVRTTIKRSDFGMTTFLPAIGDEVKIMVQVEAAKS